MEKTLIAMRSALEQKFHLEEKDFSQYSPLTLAYIGDAVFDLVIRTLLVWKCNRPSATLHRDASGIVCAKAQSEMAEKLQDLLTGEEAAVFRRGRNAKPATMAKNASRQEYLSATGLEALIGYLYLSGQYDRMLELIQAGLERMELMQDEADDTGE